MSPRRPPKAPHWPDRSAHFRRRHARRVFWVVVALLLVLPWFGYSPLRDWIGPGVDEPVIEDAPALARPEPQTPQRTPTRMPLARAGDHSDVAADGEIEAIGRDARAGDGDAATARLADLGAQVHRDALLADRGSAVRREAARRELAAMPGVRGAGWVDRMTVLLLVSSHGAAQSAVSDACRRLATHGDVSGLAVRVQEVAANAGAAASLQGECRQGRPDAARVTQEPGTSAGPADPAAEAERRRRQEESLRILSDSTPELPLPPEPRENP